GASLARDSRRNFPPRADSGAWLDNLRHRLAPRIARVKSQNRSDGGDEVDRFDRPVYHDVLANTWTEHHHPCGSRDRIAGAVVLESIAAGFDIGIASEIRQDEHSGLIGVFGILLDGLPQFGAKPVTAPDAVDIERERAGMRDIDIVQRDPE